VKLLDTSVAVDHLRGYRPATALLESLLQSEDAIVASELTRFELLAGVRPDEQAGLENFFTVLDWALVTEDIARRAGAYARFYRRSHAGIGAADYLIAGTSSALDAELLTVNVRHFPMFDGLKAPYSYERPLPFVQSRKDAPGPRVPAGGVGIGTHAAGRPRGPRAAGRGPLWAMEFLRAQALAAPQRPAKTRNRVKRAGGIT
jgi:predicted nucleic acid-binding protein